MSTPRYLFAVVAFWASAQMASAALHINELQSSNFSTYASADSSFPDWVEIYNSGTSAVNLAGYFLSDNPARFDKWTFPAVTIGANQYLLVLASGLESASGGALHASFKLSAEGETLVLSNPQGGLLDSVSFGNFPTDKSWGRYPDGVGDWFLHGSPSPASANRSATAQSVASEPRFSMPGGMYRSSEPSAGMEASPLDHTHASNNAYAGTNSSVTPGTGSEFYVASGGYTHILYSLATADPNDYSGYEIFLNSEVSLSGARDCELRATIPAGKRLDVGFQQSDLNGRNRYRYVITGTGVENDTYTIPLLDPTGVLNLSALVSFKIRAADPGSMDVKLYQMRFFTEANTGGPVRVSLTADAGDQIRYTTNGSEPSESSQLYSAPLELESTTRIRARAFGNNKLPSFTVSHTYFINEVFPVPVVSIQMLEADLTSSSTGIYVLGPNASGAEPRFGANFWEDWEKPINFEFFEADGRQAISQRAGVSIFGGWSRANARKSLAIFSRNVYGKQGFDYPFFSNRPHTSYRNLVLRASGNDWDQALIRDGVMSGLVDQADIELQAWRPCLVLINGENFGMHFLREKVNEHMIANRYGIEDPDQIDILEYRGTVVQGDSTHYMEMIEYIEQNDLSQSAPYEWVKQQMDVANYAAYYASQIYFANTDWPGNNIKYWRYRAPGNRWRWLLYDTDFGFDLWSGAKNNSASSNNLSWALNSQEVHDQANSPRATFLFRTLMGNREFRDLFIVTLADFLNTYFEPTRVRSHIDSLRAMVTPGLDLHWQATRYTGGHNSYAFNDNITAMRNFGRDRAENVRGHVRSRYSLSETSLSINTVGVGRVKLTSHAFVQGDWSGTYFLDIPVTLTATPVDGHPFIGWSGAISSSEPVITLPMSSATAVTATFGTDPNYRAPVPTSPVIIPEPVVATAPPSDWSRVRHGMAGNLQISGSQLRFTLNRAGMYALTFHTASGERVAQHRGWGEAGVQKVALPRTNGVVWARLLASDGGQFTLAIPPQP